MDVTELTRYGYVTLSYPQKLNTEVLDAMQSWKNFCELPRAEKEVLSNGDRVRDFGYMRRADTGDRVDDKELFHVSRNTIGELREKAEHISDARAITFIHAIDTLISGVAASIENFAKHVEETYELAGFTEEVSASQDRWTFRYLRYAPNSQMLAHPHADRGGFTLHLHESHPGGEYFSFDNTWKPWPIGNGQTIIFPGMGLQYRSNNQLKALWHQVVPGESTQTEPRYAMVAFIDFTHDVRYNDRAKRLQDFDPGFNYDMPFEEFQKLFIPRDGANTTTA